MASIPNPKVGADGGEEDEMSGFLMRARERDGSISRQQNGRA